MGSSAIFNGAYVKLLKDQLKLKDSARILTGTDDPTSVAKEGETGSIYLRQALNAVVPEAISALGTGINSNTFEAVECIAVYNNEVYVGGSFTTANGAPANYLAKWNGTSWVSVGTVNNRVVALKVYNNELYLGGNFTNINGVTGASYLAKWNGTTFSTVGGGSNFFNTVVAFEVYNNELYIGGYFTGGGGVSGADYIVKYNGSTFSLVGPASSLNSQVRALAVYGSDLYIGGNFTNTGGFICVFFVRWNGSAFSVPAGNPNAFNGQVLALAVYSGKLYIGGGFTGNVGVRLVSWNGTAYATLSGTNLNNEVNALISHSGSLYIGGNFSDAFGITGASDLVRYDGTSFYAVGAANAFNSTFGVLAFATNNSTLYIGGYFNNVNGAANTGKVVSYVPSYAISAPAKIYTKTDNGTTTNWKELVDTFNDQTIGGDKTFTGSMTFSGLMNSLTANQDRGMKLIEGGTWTVSGTAPSFQVSFDATAYIQIPGLPNVRNTITTAQSPISITNGQAAYVNINRTGTASSNLTVSVASIDSIDATNGNLVIIARGTSDGVFVGTSTDKLAPGQSSTLESIGTILANVTTAALKVTQTGTGDAILVEDQASDTTPFVVKADGKVGIGTTSPTTPLHVNGNVRFGNGGAYLTTSAGDNFQLFTGTNSPNPNFVIGMGNGSGAVDTSRAHLVGEGGTSPGRMTFVGATFGVGPSHPDVTTPPFRVTTAGTTVINVNSSADALKITQAGTGNALVVEDQASDTTPFVVDASGNTSIGADVTVTGILKLGTDARIIRGTDNPTSVAKNAEAGSLYLKTDPDVNFTIAQTSTGVQPVTSSPGYIGNTFIAAANAPVTQAGFYFRYEQNQVGPLTGTLYYRLYSVSGGLPTTLLAVSNGIDASTIPSSLTLMMATFTSAPTLTAGVQYAIVFDTNAVSPRINLRWSEGNIGAIPGWTQVNNGGGGTGTSWASYPNFPVTVSITQAALGVNGGVYVKNDNGTTTNWKELGSGSVDKVTQASHGFAVGDVLYLNGSTYTKANASAAATSEVVGVVSRVIDTGNFEVMLNGELSGLVASSYTENALPAAGEAVFLSTTAGKLTVTEPSTVGEVSLPIGVASGSGSLYVFPKRGAVVGGANARTLVGLANNTVTSIQLVTAYDAGELTGWVNLPNSTPANSKKFYVQIQFAKNGLGTDYNVAFQTTGDTPPAGFNVDYSGGYVRVTLPNISGLTNSSINFALNAPAVGATLPLAIDSENIMFSVVKPKDANGINVRNFANTATNLSIADTGVVSFFNAINFDYMAVTSATTLNTTHYYVSASGSTTYAITLPTAVGVQGRVYIVKSNMNAGVLLTVNTTSSQTIDGATSRALARFESLQVISNGSNWEVF